ncbi:N-acetyltransferase B complex non-catalytic subunit [Penicillium chermesinum]|nr:N-acetyltransferase B complex non-catalytic subunit [Penicillium chermesinum]
MASNNDAVFLRRNNQIQDAIDGQNLKQALQLIEKRMKKGENTRFLKAWKANIQVRMLDETNRKRGIADTLELCKSEPAITDLETLDILIQTLKKLEGHDETQSALWERAAKAKPQDLEIQLRWFSSSFEEDKWKAAQKAGLRRKYGSMSLQKNFPRERKYYFWAIFTSHQISVDEKSSEADCKLFGTLAYRMIVKAAEEVPKDPAQIFSHPRGIQTSEEMMLLLQILKSQGRFAESVKLLNSETVGINSAIINNDKEFTRLKSLNLGAGKLWEESLSFVKSFYTMSDDEKKQKELLEYDDWVIWNLLIESARHIGTPEAINDARTIAEDFINFNPKSRNACLALVDIAEIDLQKGNMTKDEYFEFYKGYVDRQSHRVFAFGDIRRLIGDDKDSMAKILEYLCEKKDQSPNPFVSTINALKLEYCLKISGADSKPSRQHIEGFVTRCLELYRENVREQDIEKTESPPRDDLPVLAIMAILSEEGDLRPSGPALIRSAAIVERFLHDSPHNSTALLVLVRCYILLGAGSLAMTTFNRLSVKQMQWETIAHNLFTRLSTIHPHSAPPVEGTERSEFDPQAGFLKALNFYRNADITTMKYRTRGLEEGAYSNLGEVIELRSRLNHSICRRLWALHIRQAQRIVGGDSTARFDEIAKNNLPCEDSRNYQAFMSCEFPGKPIFEHRLRVGPSPKEGWMRSARITDQLFAVLKSVAIQKPLAPGMDLPDLSSLSLSDDDDRTETEKENAKIHSELLKVATFLAGSKAINAEQVDAAFAVVEDWLIAKIKTLTPSDSDGNNRTSPIITDTAVHLHVGHPTGPTWTYLHALFSLLETLKALSQLVILGSKKGPSSVKLPKERLDRLAAMVPEVYELVRSNAKALKSAVSAPGVLSDLVDNTIQGDSSKPYGQEVQSVIEEGFSFDFLLCFDNHRQPPSTNRRNGRTQRYRAWQQQGPLSSNQPELGYVTLVMCEARIIGHQNIAEGVLTPIVYPTPNINEEEPVNKYRIIKLPPLNTPKTKISRTKGKSSHRTKFVREIAREVVGLAPYERRVIELLRNAQDKRARKLAKKRLGTFGRGKRKVEDMQGVIAEARRVQGH